MEMGLAALAPAGMALMLVGLVRHLEALGLERGGELGGDRLGDRHGANSAPYGGSCQVAGQGQMKDR